MQKNNCKLKTIFKKGLSFSIALALGAAATSLNLAKTAEAAVDTLGARTVYLAGENAEFDTSGWSNKPSYYSTDDDENWLSVNEPVKLNSDMTKLEIASDDSGSDKTDYTFKVYDWAKIYKGTTVKVAHGTATNAMFTAENINFGGGVDGNSAAVREILNKGELHVDGIEGAVTKIDYTAQRQKSFCKSWQR